MKRLLFVLLGCWPLLAGAQSVPVPPDVYFAGLHLRLTPGGRQLVQQKVDALRSHTTSFQARVNLADAYFPIIDRVLQQEAVPLDFRYLAVQESGLQGEAQSIHDAVGYWQFKRETAQDYGLLMTDAVDERKHIVAATHAAAKYLQHNNIPLHNWVNTLLSYNLGAGGVKPYTLPTDFEATEMEISEQTHPYILTLLAHKVAYEPAVGHNPRPPLVLQEFPAPAGFTLVSIAQTLQTSPAEMARHNRWLLTPTVPSDKIYTILVPVVDPIQLTAMAAQQKNATAGQLLNKPQTDPQNADYVRVNGIRALIALPGDTKESLAQRAGLKMRKFMQFNDLFAFDNLVVGQPYFVQKKRDKAATEYHAAQPGESVATVSQKYGIRAKAIWSKNRMPRNEELRPGRILWLQHTRPKDVAIEYADNKNTAALAAFERPATPPAPGATAAVEPTPKKRRPDANEPYMGKTAEAARVLDDAVDAPDTLSVSPSLATQPDSATDAATENLNELLPAPQPAPQTSVSAATPRTLYGGRPARPEAPVASAATNDSRSLEASPAITPAAKPARQPVAPVPTAPRTIPAVAASPAAAPVVSKPLPPVFPTGSSTEVLPANGLHTVQAKEGLYAVARRYGLLPANLIAWNNLPQNPSLRVGQRLRLTAPQGAIPASSALPTAPKPASPVPTASSAVSPAPPAAALASIRYPVGAGESMYAISRKYGVTIKQIMEWNNKVDFNVHPGEVLLIKPTKLPQ